MTPAKHNSRKVTFGSVSTISTAPVTMGNSVRGSTPKIQNIPGGIRVSGRDFAAIANGTGSVATWVPCAGFPVSPVAFTSSIMKQYMNMYSHYKINACVFHYITSSPTSANGDVLFFVQKTHSDPMVNWTSNNFLPFVMSDDCTIIGPQWQNNSIAYRPEPSWIKTDYVTNDDENDQAVADLFLFSKTSTTDSPGYVLIDYEIEFRGLQLNVKNTIYPIARTQWNNISYGGSSVSLTQGNGFDSLSLYGNNTAGNAGALPSGILAGDIYKCFFDVTNSVFGTNYSATNLIQYEEPNVTAVTISDGFTCYAVYAGSNAFRLYPNLDSAIVSSGSNYLGIGASHTTGVMTLQLWISLVATQAGTLIQSNI